MTSVQTYLYNIAILFRAMLQQYIHDVSYMYDMHIHLFIQYIPRNAIPALLCQQAIFSMLRRFQERHRNHFLGYVIFILKGKDGCDVLEPGFVLSFLDVLRQNFRAT